MTRYPSGRPPRMHTKAGESCAAAVLRFRVRWQAWRDACVMAEAGYQSSLRTSAKARHHFNAFYGVEAHYLAD